MEIIRLKPEHFDINKVEFSEPKTLPNGGKAIYLNYLHDGKKKKLVIQTPKMSCPYGMSYYGDGDYPKYSLEMSFGGMESGNSLDALYKVFDSLDEKLVQAGIDNSQPWFKKKKMTKDVINALYSPHIKVSKDKETGEPNNKYPPTLKVKAPFKSDQFEFDMYDNHKTQIDPGNFVKVLTKGIKVASLIECVGLWFAGGKYGCSWKIKQLKVEPSSQISGYSFVDDSDADDEAENADATRAPDNESEVEDSEVEEDM